MAAEAVGRAHGALRVDDRTLAQLAQRGQAQSLGGRISPEAAGVECDDSEADAVDGNALAHLHVVERQIPDIEGEADIAADGFTCGQTADAFDDSSKQVTFSAKSERKTPQGKQVHAGQEPCGTVFFHPDYDRRLRHWTGSADPGRGPGRSRARACAPTAGGELHPALKTFVYRRTGLVSVPARPERVGFRGRIPSAGKGSDPDHVWPACDGRLSHFVKLSLKSAADDMRSPRAAARAGPPMD